MTFDFRYQIVSSICCHGQQYLPPESITINFSMENSPKWAVIILSILWKGSPISMNITFVTTPNPNSWLHILAIITNCSTYVSCTKNSLQTYFCGVTKLVLHCTSYLDPNININMISMFFIKTICVLTPNSSTRITMFFIWSQILHYGYLLA